MPSKAWTIDVMTTENILLPNEPSIGLTGQPEVTIQYNEDLSLWFTWSLAFGAFDIYLYTSPNITGNIFKYGLSTETYH